MKPIMEDLLGILTCMEKTRTVVCPRSPFNSSVDSARSAADAAATGNSPPQPKPNKAWAAVTNAKTACADGPSAAVSSTPAAVAGLTNQYSALPEVRICTSKAGLGAVHAEHMQHDGHTSCMQPLPFSDCELHMQAVKLNLCSTRSISLTNEHNAGCCNRAPFAADLINNQTQTDHAGKEPCHLGVV